MGQGAYREVELRGFQQRQEGSTVRDACHLRQVAQLLLEAVVDLARRLARPLSILVAPRAFWALRLAGRIRRLIHGAHRGPRTTNELTK